METVQAADIQLLKEYAQDGRASAFAAVVERHSAMVFSVCRRILGDPHAAEDATQAAFLVLARRAGALGNLRDGLGGWLHSTARHVALIARRAALRREKHELEGGFRRVDEWKGGAEGAERAAAWTAVEPRLDEALSALPAVQREAILLHYYRGLTAEAAARELECPEATVKTRLRRGLERLRGYLSRRGAAVSAALLALLLREEAWATAPAGLSASIAAACLGQAPPSPAASGLAAEALSALARARNLRLAAVAAAALAAFALGFFAPRWLDLRGGVPPVVPIPAGAPGALPPTPASGLTDPAGGSPAAGAVPFAFLDFGLDGRFDPGDRALPASLFADGEFRVDGEEPGYVPPDRPAWLVVPRREGAGSALPGTPYLGVSSPWRIVFGADLRLPPMRLLAGDYGAELLRTRNSYTDPGIFGQLNPPHTEGVLHLSSRESLEILPGTALSGEMVNLCGDQGVVVGEGARLEGIGFFGRVDIRCPEGGDVRIRARAQVSAKGETNVNAFRGGVHLEGGTAVRSAEETLYLLGFSVRAEGAAVAGRGLLIQASDIVLRGCSVAVLDAPREPARRAYELRIRADQGSLDVTGSTLSVPAGLSPAITAAKRMGEFLPPPSPPVR